MKRPEAAKAADVPIVCSLDARDLAARLVSLREDIFRDAAAIERLPDGLRCRFNAGEDVLKRLGAFIDAERQCCRFLRFALTAEPDVGCVTLDMTGPPGSAEFLAAMLPEQIGPRE
jgi:hypothetical protein